MLQGNEGLELSLLKDDQIIVQEKIIKDQNEQIVNYKEVITNDSIIVESYKTTNSILSIQNKDLEKNLLDTSYLYNKEIKRKKTWRKISIGGITTTIGLGTLLYFIIKP